MGDSYQATYDAVRSRLSNCDIGRAIESVMREQNVSFYFDQASQAAQRAAGEYERPSAVFRPKISINGDMWCALYGENLQDGVAGFGKSPADAMWDFDRNWAAKLPAAIARSA